VRGAIACRVHVWAYYYLNHIREFDPEHAGIGTNDTQSLKFGPNDMSE